MIARACRAALIIALAVTGARAEPARGLITITFDDASRSQHDLGLRLAKTYGLAGTLFVPTQLVTESLTPDGWTMTWDEVRDFQAAGWEIGAHGRTHVHMPGLDPSALADEIEGAAADILAQTGVAPVSFSSPFGDFTDATLDRIMGVYQAHLSWKGHGGRNPRAALDPRLVGRLEVIESMSSAEVCGEMVESARDGTWLVLLFHGITEGEPSDYEVSAAKAEAIFSCAALLQAGGIIKVRTVRDALSEVGGTP